MPRHLGLVGTILVGCGAVAFAAGSEPTVNVSMTVAGQEGPLEIIGFKPAVNSDGFALHIHNLSDKATRDFWIEPLVRNSRGQLWHFHERPRRVEARMRTMSLRAAKLGIAIRHNSASIWYLSRRICVRHACELRR